MESLDPAAACLMDDLLNFSSDIGEENEEEDKPKRDLASALKPNGLLGPADTIRSFHVSFMMLVLHASVFLLSFFPLGTLETRGDRFRL